MSDYDSNYKQKKTYALVGQKAIILNDRNEILIMQRSEKSAAGGKWSLPGGGLEFNEDPYYGIEREIKEETKLEVTGLEPCCLRSYLTKEKDFVLIIGYRCKSISTDVILNWEHDSYKWLTKDEALKLELTEDG